MQSKTVAQVAKEAEDFVMNEYTPAMMRIDHLTPAERKSLLDKLAGLPG